MIKKNIYTLVVQFLYLGLAFTIARIVFLIYYWKFFSSFPTSEILFSLIAGIRFDYVVISQTIGLICFILFLLGNWSHNRIVDWISFLLTLSFIFYFLSVYIADLGYYSLIKRHISFEVTLVLHDLPGAIRQAFSGYLLLIVLYILLLVITGYVWYRFWMKLRSIPDQKAGVFKHLLVIPLVFVILVFLSRGGIQSKPTDENFAFRNHHVQLGNLTLSAPYTVSIAFTRDRVKKVDHLNSKIASKTVQEMVAVPGDKFVDPQYPLMRNPSSNINITKPLLNVVIIILEGVPAHWIHSFNPDIQSATPHLDRIANKSLRFTRFFGAGTYTTQGFGALISSVPALPSITLINSSFVQNNILSIPRILKKYQYNTFFLSGYFEGSASIDSFMTSMGIEKAMNQNNFDNFEEKSHTWGVWDEFVFDRFYREISQLSPPFLAIIEPCTTHSPHDIPDEKWNYYKEGVDQRNWKNVMRYSDQTMGDFFESTSKLDSFENTLFVITSDHVSKINPDHYAESARLPLVFYTPGGQISPGINKQTTSQTDLLPTLMDVLGLKEIHASAGKSMIADNRGLGFAMHYNGSYVLWFEDDTVTRYTNMKADGHYNLNTDWNNRKNLIHQTNLAPINQHFYSYLQTVQNSLINNRLYRQ